MPKHRLVCIGDSLTQGFKSGAIFETNLSFPATIAWEMGLGEDEFRYPSYAGQGGLPINIEFLLRRLDHQFGRNLDLWEWPLVPLFLRQWMDEIEDYWERGAGTAPISYRGPYHNLAISGYQVQDAYLLTAERCQNVLSEGSTDNWVSQLVEHGLFRTALRVLNPDQSAAGKDATQISRARDMAQKDGIENLIVFLGPNNALGSVTSLSLRESTVDELLKPDPRDRPSNLYLPEHFEIVFAKLVEEVETIGAERVFWGTVPPVTIAPVTNGVNGRMENNAGLDSPYGPDDHEQWYRRYFRYYTRPWVPDARFSSIDDECIRGQDAMRIDGFIARYKQVLLDSIDRHNAPRAEKNWFPVDIHWALERIAYRRYTEDPSVPPPPGWSPYEMPASLERLQLDTRFLKSRDGVRIQGGIFSLDGVHATTAAYGLLAQEFINVMQQAGVRFCWGDGVTPRVGPVIVDYERLIRLDTLLQGLPQTLDDVWGRIVDGDQILDVFKRAWRALSG